MHETKEKQLSWNQKACQKVNCRNVPYEMYVKSWNNLLRTKRQIQNYRLED